MLEICAASYDDKKLEYENLFKYCTFSISNIWRGDKNILYSNKNKMIIETVGTLIICTFFIFYSKKVGISSKIFYLLFAFEVSGLYFRFKDNKVKITEDYIELSTLFKSKKTFFWSDIISIKIKKVSSNRVAGTKLILTLDNNDDEYNFNIMNMANLKKLLKDIINKCAINDIQIDDLTSKEKIFFTNLKIGLKQDILCLKNKIFK